MSEEQKPVGDEPKAKKAKKDKKLLPRQGKLLKAIVAGKSLGDAAIQAGYSPKNARQSAWCALRTIRVGMAEAADNIGFTPQEFFYKVIHPGMFSEVTPRGTYMGGFFEMKDANGNTVRDPDSGNRAKFALIWAKLTGALREEEKVKVEVEHTHTIDLRQVPREALIAVVRLAAAYKSLPGGGGTVPPRTIDVAPGQ